MSRTIENKRASFRWTGDVSFQAVGGRRRSQPISEWQFGPLFVCLDPSSDHSSDQRRLRRGKSFLRTDSRFGTVPRAWHGKKGVKVHGKVGEIRGATSDVNLYPWVRCSLSDRQGACSTVSMKKTCSQSNHPDAQPLGGNVHPMGVGGIQSDYPTAHTLRIELGHTFRSGWRKTHSRPRLADSDIKI